MKLITFKLYRRGAGTIEEEPWWKNLLKYFLHGIVFSILVVVLTVVWFLISAFLVMIGSFLGLVIGIMLAFLLVGGLNSVLTRLVWSIPIKTRWLGLLIHGLVLLIALVVVGVPFMIMNYNFPDLAATTGLFIVQSFVNGFVAKKVAIYWKEEYEEPIAEINQALDTKTSLSSCAETNILRSLFAAIPLLFLVSSTLQPL